MLLDILLIVVGIVLVLTGADRMTEGASAIARRWRVPELVIGLTIVAAGTSAPELFVSLVSALRGTPDMAVGNVIGSNIFNTLLIVGCAAMVAPMTIAVSTVRKDIPATVIASVLLIGCCVDRFDRLSLNGNMISRIDGIVLVVCFALFMRYTLRQATASKQDATETVTSVSLPSMSLWAAWLWLLAGLAALIFGSNLFVGSASSVAVSLGMSESVVGLTIVAGGTSLPELATSVVAARKGQSAIAIGNVIGSNVFNILAILGLTALVCPMRIGGITLLDVAVQLFSILLLWFFCYTKYTVARWEGALLTLLFLGYMSWILV